MPRATVESVREYEVKGPHVELSCAVSVDDGPEQGEEHARLPARTIPVHLRFLAPDTFRFELDAAPEVGDATTTLDLDTGAIGPPPDVDVTETDGQLFIETGALSVEIGLDPWAFAVHDAEGGRLLTEQRGDISAKAERRAKPLGYDLEMVNRWPYRRNGAGTSFVLDSHEHIYGLGETFTGFDKRGETIDCWVTQPNGTETGHAYKNVPFYLSTAGYGLLVDTDQRTEFDIGDSSVVSTQVSVEDDTFAFVFMRGPALEDILETYTALTGRPDRVPRWSYGIWFSRLGYESRGEVDAVLDRAEDEDIPVDVIHLDPPWLDELCNLRWDEEAFPNPPSFVERLHERDVRLCLWEYPYLLSESEAFEEAREAGYLVEDGTGQPYVLDRLSWSSDRGAIVDFTDPDAASWWAERHRNLVEMGVDAFKCDFGEYLPEDAVLADGTSGRASRNRYPHRYVQTVRDAVADAGGDPLLWVRAGWAGGQRFPVHWGGDPATTFESMAASLRGGLSVGLSGYGFWSADVGGFKGKPSTELYVRWAQLGLLGNSHVRFHGTTPREPWHFGEEATEIVRQYAEERYRLLPYLETLGAVAADRGLPVVRPLVLAFPEDHGARTCEDQLMLGPALMIAPVCRPGGRRDVYLPPGEWVDYWTGERLEGGRTLTRELDLDELPVYIRAGTVHPRTSLEEADPATRPDELRLRTALADGTAEAEVLDPDDQRLRNVTVERSGDEVKVTTALGVPVTVEMLGVSTAPDRVELDGVELREAASAPGPGEWTFDRDENSLTAVGPR